MNLHVKYFVYIEKVEKKMNSLNLEDLYDIYDIFDHDEDGLISIIDLVNSMDQLNEHITFMEALEFVREFDTDGDLHLNFNEFIKLLVCVYPHATLLPT